MELKTILGKNLEEMVYLLTYCNAKLYRETTTEMISPIAGPYVDRTLQSHTDRSFNATAFKVSENPVSY